MISMGRGRWDPGTPVVPRSPKDDDPLGRRLRDWQAFIIRVCDISLSLVGLIVAAPLFVPIAILIKLDSRGPIFFLDERVGKDMMRFHMFKFRTMLERSTKIDQSLCPQFDPRVTAFGRFLRRTKLNELPQLLNVLKGDMSFVGPRPEAPDLAELYPDEAKQVFSVKPGLVGPAVIYSLRGSVRGRNEEELYPPGVDPKQYYLQQILPEKIKLDLFYLSRQSVLNYFWIILSAVKETVFGAFNAKQIDNNKRRILLFIADFTLCQLSYALAYQLYLRTTGTCASLKVYLSGFILITAVRSLFHYSLGLYDFLMELITPRDIYRVSLAVGLGSLVMMLVSALLGTHSYPPVVALLDFGFLCLALMSVRLLLMVRFRHAEAAVEEDRRPRVLIFGANRNGLAALRAMGGSKSGPFEVVGFIDDAMEKYARKIGGIKVLGNRHHIRTISLLHDVRDIVLAPRAEAWEELGDIAALCAQAGIRSQIFDSDVGDAAPRELFPLRPLQVADLLPPVHVSLDEPVLRSLLKDRTVLMLASGGELGAAICRKVVTSGCRKVVIVDRYEAHLREVLSGLRKDIPGPEIVPVFLEGGDIEALNKVFARHRPQIVIHAGMRKFITLQGADDEEIARSNYLRTFNLAKAATSHGCEYFVLISSIKAASRGNLVSESLRVAESSLNAFFSRTPTRLIVARVGNIIENRGGIVSWLNDQILGQRPLRLPAETAKTFLLSKNAAARSVLQALAMGTQISPGGHILTAEPGVCLGLADVAAKIARLYGLSVGQDVTLKFGEIPDGLIDDEPATVIAAAQENGDSLIAGLGSEAGLLMIERIISLSSPDQIEPGWIQQTEELASLWAIPWDRNKRDDS
jgi:FlaA1/EpsC-like NDP-sugar epimerase/lipopolysaccharide/colanic/teichoic acid biosynthesis glycosyltransferase